MRVQADDLVRASGSTGNLADQRMVGPPVYLAGAEPVLDHLLAGTQAGEDDLDRAAGARGQPPGDVRDAHRFAHVQHEDLTVRPTAAAWMTSWAASSASMK